MSKYTDTNIKNLVEWINKTYLLPDLQRPFVWWDNASEFEDKVCSLFDSILRKYPIWTMLFWKVDKQRVKEDWIIPLKFINSSNDDRNELYWELLENKDYILVLDWQQRLTIFNLVFNWVFEDSNKGKIRKRNLYMNLFKNTEMIDNINDNLYEFKLFESSNGEYFLENDALWYRVKDVLNLSLISKKKNEIREKFSLDSTLEAIMEINLETLKNSLNEQNISYYEIEKEKKDEEALEIFVRVNSKWTVLSYSDLLFSKITQYWKIGNDWNSPNARDLFYMFLKWDNLKWTEKWINRYWDWFDFDNDFILKTSLVLIDSEIRYRLKNFNKENIEKIKINWEKITKSIRVAIEFINSIWIKSNQQLGSNNSIIPLIYFIYYKNLENRSIEINSENYKPMKIYLYLILINSVFGGQTDQLLSDARKVIKENIKDTFPLNEIIKKLSEKRSIKKNNEIRELLDNIKYKTDKNRIILSLIYWNEYNNSYQEDHLYPQSKTKIYCEKNNINKSIVDNIGNIQILKTENQKKNDKEYKFYREEIIRTVNNYDEINLIPQLDNELVDYTFDYFQIFLEKRKELIFNKIVDYFTLNDTNK